MTILEEQSNVLIPSNIHNVRFVNQLSYLIERNDTLVSAKYG